jgi:hypothetical protein
MAIMLRLDAQDSVIRQTHTVIDAPRGWLVYLGDEDDVVDDEL